MSKVQKFISSCRVKPDSKVRLKDYDPGWEGTKKSGVSEKKRKKFAETLLSEDVAELAEVQDKLYASDTWSVLIVLQAMDAAGKDSTIKHVMSGVNPQGCEVHSFKHPSAEELDHNFMWRYARAVPERGKIGIFNRSYFEEVLILRVHPELLTAERIPNIKASKKVWEERFEDINNFEKHLARNGTLIMKFFLHTSKEEQRKRFLKRLDDPAKHWKFSEADLVERGYWDKYMNAYEDMLGATSTEYAPWYIIPANHKWVARALIASIITDSIKELGLKYPAVSKEKAKELRKIRAKLTSPADQK